MKKVYFLAQAKHNVNGSFDKGLVIKDTEESAKQSMHAYFGAYGYGNDANIDMVICVIYDSDLNIIHREIYDKNAGVVENG